MTPFTLRPIPAIRMDRAPSLRGPELASESDPPRSLEPVHQRALLARVREDEAHVRELLGRIGDLSPEVFEEALHSSHRVAFAQAAVREGLAAPVFQIACRASLRPGALSEVLRAVPPSVVRELARPLLGALTESLRRWPEEAGRVPADVVGELEDDPFWNATLDAVVHGPAIAWERAREEPWARESAEEIACVLPPGRRDDFRAEVDRDLGPLSPPSANDEVVWGVLVECNLLEGAPHPSVAGAEEPTTVIEAGLASFLLEPDRFGNRPGLVSSATERALLELHRRAPWRAHWVEDRVLDADDHPARSMALACRSYPDARSLNGALAPTRWRVPDGLIHPIAELPDRLHAGRIAARADFMHDEGDELADRLQSIARPSRELSGHVFDTIDEDGWTRVVVYGPEGAFRSPRLDTGGVAVEEHNGVLNGILVSLGVRERVYELRDPAMPPARFDPPQPYRRHYVVLDEAEVQRLEALGLASASGSAS